MSPSSRAETWATVARVAAVAAVVRLMGAAIAWKLGFRAVSDDDFARVVIAQKFAAHPHLDPTGSSWLPFPFWLHGAVMAVAGRTLAVARVVTLASAALSTALVAGVASFAGLRASRAIAASVLVAAMPWGMQLAVATVPEASAAAFAAAGAITLAHRSPRLRVVGAAALLASCWSRYDAWPIALAFAVLSTFDAARAKAERRERVIFFVAAAVAIAGPVGWTAWQAVVYHDAFRYLRLVRSYRQAIGGPGKVLTRVLGYPLGVVEEMREVAVAGFVALIAWIVVRTKSRRGEAARAARAPLRRAVTDLPWGRPLAVAAIQLLTLIAGDLRDGAPTHHPERALLGGATIVVFASADALGALLSSIDRPALRASLAAIALGWLLWWIPTRLHRSLPWYASAPRTREIAAGEALARATRPGAHVLLDTRDLGGIDYGYFAVLAAFGRPEDATIDRDQDPRRPRPISSFVDAGALAARAAEADARVLLAWGDDRRAVAESLGGRVVEVEPGSELPRWSVVMLP